MEEYITCVKFLSLGKRFSLDFLLSALPAIHRLSAFHFQNDGVWVVPLIVQSTHSLVPQYK
jgi:hypothetical protein